MLRLLTFCNRFQASILEKKLFFFSKNSKLLNLFLHFLQQEGFLLRVMTTEKKLLKIFLKYSNGLSSVYQVHFYIKNNQKIFLTRQQVLQLLKKNPNIYFVFFSSGRFLNKAQILKNKCGGLLVCSFV